MAFHKNFKMFSHHGYTAQMGLRPSFPPNAFGWKSDMPIHRIKEALSEIKAVDKKDPVLAAEGAVLFWESWHRLSDR